MKILHAIIFILLLGQNLFAQYNLSPDAPANPIPIKFHKDHFFLKGNVKSLKKYNSEGKIQTEYFFDEQGYLIKDFEYNHTDTPYEDFGDISTKYTKHIYYYNDNNELTEIKCNNYFNDLKIVPDNNGRPGKSIDFDKNIRKFEYDINGNLIKEYTANKTDMNYYFDYEYQYDNKNRLIKKTVFKSDGSLKKIVTYSYQQNGEFLKVTENNGKETSVWYYKNGHYCGTKPINMKSDEEGNPVSYDGNPCKYTYYSNEKRNKETCLSGDCQNGWGTQQYQDGKYIGFFENGLREGYGKYTWNTGEFYEGQWKQDKITGHGIYLYANKDFKQGEFRDGKLDGLGVEYINGKWKQGVYSNGKLVTPYEFSGTGHKTGCVGGNCKDGYGRYIWNSGSNFNGFFKNNRPYNGTYAYSNGDKYIGYLNRDVLPDRFGMYRYNTGSLYVGEWKNGKKHGKGYYEHESGVKLIGIWENDKLVKSLKK